MMDIVLIPAFEPDSQLIGIADRLSDEGFKVLVVDDGSGEKYANIFEEVRKYATVITLEKNCGKGAALKTGMRYIRDNIPECENFITCDADGQHRIEDVIRVKDVLHSGQKFVLTVRNPKRGIPLRSKVGNGLSRFVYTLLANRYLSDNQSGLRGFSKIHIDWLIKVENDKYDYEMNVLYYASKKGIYICTLPIEAIYIDNNESSHFSPIADTVRIYRSLFKLARGTFIAFALSEIIIITASLIFGYKYITVSVPSAAAISYLVNILLNKFFIFKTTPCYDYWTTLIYTVIEYFVYMLGCMLFMFALPEIPLWAAFNISYLIGIPLRYYLHKFIFVASRTKE